MNELLAFFPTLAILVVVGFGIVTSWAISHSAISHSDKRKGV